jgi:hypothetical protein
MCIFMEGVLQSCMSALVKVWRCGGLQMWELSGKGG